MDRRIERTETLIDLMEPEHRLALSQLDPSDPDVALVLVSSYIAHLKGGGEPAFFVYQGMVFTPLVERAIVTYLTTIADVQITDEELLPGLDKIIEAVPETTRNPNPEPPTRQRPTLRIEEIAEGPDSTNMVFAIMDDVGPLASFKSEEEAQNYIDVHGENLLKAIGG